ncbi:MAG: GNAT family N-acetyltransferase, partial [Chloroflexota bacterium]
MMIEPGFAVRPPVLADADAVTALFRACEHEHWGTAEFTVDEVRDHWTRSPNFDLSTDAWLVLSDGKAAAYGEVNPRRPIRLNGFGEVHPDFRGRGIGSALLRRIETRARQMTPAAPEGLRVVVDGGTAAHDQVSRALYEAHGYQAIRYFRRMVIDLGEEPPLPIWPEGIAVRPIVVGEDDFLIFSTNQEAFQDHWGFYPAPFESWRKARMSGAEFDPSLWFLAMHGTEAAGVLLCTQTPETAWVS